MPLPWPRPRLGGARVTPRWDRNASVDPDTGGGGGNVRREAVRVRRYALPGGQRDMELRPPLPPVPLEVAPEPAPNPLLTSGQLLVEDAWLAILQIIPAGACILSCEA